MNTNTNTNQSNGFVTIVNDNFKNIYNGKTLNTAYFYEKYRNVVVIFNYNYLTSQGEYTACIWHRCSDDSTGISWHRKSHRQTAQERFNKCTRIPFNFVFKADDKHFYDNLKKEIRRTIHAKGVKGAHLKVSKDGLTVVRSTKATHSLKEFSSSSSTTNTNTVVQNATNSVVN